MKYIYLSLILVLSLNADSIYSNGKCVKFFDTSDNNQLYLEYSRGTTQTVKFNRANAEFLINNMNKFELVNGECRPIEGKFGMTSFQFNFLMALSGLLIGFTWLFFSMQIVMYVGGRK